MKESSLKSLKQKIQKNQNFQYDPTTNSSIQISQKSITRMSGPTIDMISTNDNNGGYGPGYSSPSEKLDPRLANSRFAVPPNDPIPVNHVRSSGSRFHGQQQQHSSSSAGYSRKDIEERSSAADKSYRESQLQQQHQQSHSVHSDQFYHTMPDAAASGLHHSSSSNSSGRLVRQQSSNNQLSDTNNFMQSFPGNVGSNSTGKQMQSQHSSSVSGSRRVHSVISNSSQQQFTPHQHPVEVDRRCVEVGLENLGNTCFMNSTLQCLLHIQPLVHYFLTSDVEQDLNLASPKKGVLATSFLQLVREMYSKQPPARGSGHNTTTNVSIAPTSFQKAVGIYAPYLMDFQQQDSQEFLRFLLDGMSEDLCRKHSTRAPQPEPLESISRFQRHQPLSANNAVGSPAPTTPGSISSSLNHHSGSPYSSPNQLEESHASLASLSSPQMKRNASNTNTHTVTTTNSSILPMLTLSTGGHTPTHSTESNSATSPQTSPIFRQPRVDGEGSGSPSQSNANKLRVVTEVSEARKIGAPISEFDSPQQVSRRQSGSNTASNSADEDDDLSSSRDRADISGNIRDVIQARRSIRMRASKPSPRQQAIIGQSAQHRSSNQNQAEEQEEFGSVVDPNDPSHESHRQSDFSHDKQTQQTKAAPGGSKANRVTVKSTNAHILGVGSDSGGHGQSGVHSTAVSAAPVVHSPEQEAAVAWERYLKLNDSVITDIFAGQLQSTIECLTCHHRSSSYDPFLDLSVPIHRECDNPGRGLFNAIKSTTIGDGNKSTLEKCLAKFTGEEILDGENMYTCEKCKAKRKSAKKLSIFKYPRVLVIHIKRFRFNSHSREKLSTDVHFPLAGLDLSPYISPDIHLPTRDSNNNNSSSLGANNSGRNSYTDDRPATVSDNQQDNSGSSERFETHSVKSVPSQQVHQQQKGSSASGKGEMSFGVSRPVPVYDLVGVSNHHGSLHGGHYIAHVDTNNHNKYAASGSSSGGHSGMDGGASSPRWMCFNDARVTNAQASNIAGPTAYVLFYKMREE